MNFFKKIFQTEESEDPTIDDKTSTKACVALLLETSMAAAVSYTHLRAHETDS